MTTASLFLAVALSAPASDVEQTLRTMPVAIQRAVQTEQAQGATLRTIAKEVASGVTVYEAEMMRDGRRRDILFGEDGKIVSLEEQRTLSEIPAGARDAIEKAVGAGKLALVEKVTRGPLTFYEGHIRRGEQLIEVKVDADGKPVQ